MTLRSRAISTVGTAIFTDIFPIGGPPIPFDSRTWPIIDGIRFYGNASSGSDHFYSGRISQSQHHHGKPSQQSQSHFTLR
jgi:hypothetical protein